jgi:hypothetical protein
MKIDPPPSPRFSLPVMANAERQGVNVMNIKALRAGISAILFDADPGLRQPTGRSAAAETAYPGRPARSAWQEKPCGRKRRNSPYAAIAA